MAIKWNINKDYLIEFNLTGQLVYKEYREFLAELEPIAKKAGEVRLLAILNDFTGWDENKGWEDSSITDRTDPYMKKMAIVGDEKWRDMVELFTLKGLRSVAIEYFSSDNEQAAREWLES